MERLTNEIDGIYWGDWDDIRIGQKLGELEDVLEKYNIDDLDKFISDLQKRVDYLEHELKVAIKTIQLLAKSNISNVTETERQPLIELCENRARYEIKE